MRGSLGLALPERDEPTCAPRPSPDQPRPATSNPGMAARSSQRRRTRSTIADVRELRSGLWHWQAPHPDWTPDEPWDEMVSSYAIDDGERLLLFDPLAVPDELMNRAA